MERESQNGPMNNGPQKFSGWSKSLLRVCTLVHTIVGPERLATIEMVVLIDRMLII